MYPEKQGGFPKQPDEAHNHAGTRGQCCITKFPARGRKHQNLIWILKCGRHQLYYQIPRKGTVMFLVRKSPIVMGCRDRGFFCLESGKGRRSFVEDRVVRSIVDLSPMPVEGRIAVLWWGGREEYPFESGCDIIRTDLQGNR